MAKVVVFVLVTVLSLLSMRSGFPRMEVRSPRVYLPQRSDLPSIVFDGARWRRVLDWRFSRGPYPGGWAWGKWWIVKGALRGMDLDGTSAVYFFPFTHGGDVILETRVKLLKSVNGREVEAQLLTRDSDKLNFESGLVIHAGADFADVRHMAGMVNYIYEQVPLGRYVEYGRWHILRFVMHRGKVMAYIDGREVFDSNPFDRLQLASLPEVPLESPLPAGIYREPHLTVVNGAAEFSYVRIYVTSD